MQLDDVRQILSTVKISAIAPSFLSQLFSLLVKKRGKQIEKLTTIEQICVEEYDGLSKSLDRTQIQQSCNVRNNLKTKALAEFLIDDQGSLQTDRLSNAIVHFRAHLYSLGPDRQHDVMRQQHILRVLEILYGNKDLQNLLKRICKPFSYPYADQLIRDTLELKKGTIVTDTHARRAALSAWLCYLRQNVGSCFATAPAIVVHDEEPELFLADIRDLLGMGRITRTFEGVEYSVPLSMSWGSGDLKKPFILNRDIASSSIPYWESPGLLTALTEVGMIRKALPLSERAEESKKLLVRILEPKAQATSSFFTTSMEEVLTLALLEHFSLTEQDLSDYENRPMGMIYSSLMMQSSSRSRAGKGDSCRAFYAKRLQAFTAFRSLADNALLKSWEFTVASFAEVKPTISRYNLYHSLGLGPFEDGGIGSCLYQAITAKLNEANALIREYQEQYEQMFGHVKYMEGRLQRASTEKDFKWLKTEYQSRLGDLHHYEELRNQTHHKARCFSELFDRLLDLYDKKFIQYFQEIYDADIQEVSVGPYDDSPAGFRLLYKAGRSHTAQWERITDANGFVNALTGFFVTTEAEIVSSPEIEPLKGEVEQIISAVVNHVKTQPFIETAFYRMAVAHHIQPVKKPLENLDKIEKKPWVYTSGGAMGTLVSCYFGREDKPTEVSRWVENEVELLAFLLDTVKLMPNKNHQEFLDNPKKSMLMYSPTHAFLLKPGFSPFRDGWQSDLYTYTWVRDFVISPGRQFLDSFRLDEDMTQTVLETLAESVPYDYRRAFLDVFRRPPSRVTSAEFRSIVVDAVVHNRALSYRGRPIFSVDDVDSTLYSLLPMIRAYNLPEVLENVFRALSDSDDVMVKQLMQIYGTASETFGGRDIITAKSLRELCQSLLLLYFGMTNLPRNLIFEVTDILQKQGLAMPKPVIFADANWSKDYFGFVVSPGSNELELWRFDALGIEGVPMSAWRHWVNGSRQDRSWGVYTRPYEYYR